MILDKNNFCNIFVCSGGHLGFQIHVTIEVLRENSQWLFMYGFVPIKLHVLVSGGK